MAACIAALAAQHDLATADGVELSASEGIGRFNRAATAAIVSIMSKMGISTMQSYHSAQIFEAVGLAPELIDRCFAGTVSRVGGMGIDDVQRELDERYDAALALNESPAPSQLPTLGLTKWRPLDGGEDHLIDPQTIFFAAERGASRRRLGVRGVRRACTNRDASCACATCSTSMRQGARRCRSMPSRARAPS